ncbi:hypothetical protein ACFPRL_30410 [Pseudoclavibacter helvolus]
MRSPPSTDETTLPMASGANASAPPIGMATAPRVLPCSSGSFMRCSLNEESHLGGWRQVGVGEGQSDPTTE